MFPGLNYRTHELSSIWKLINTVCEQVTSLITQSLSQYTRKERAIIDAVKVKFGLILLVFYICWLPNLVNSVLLWTEWTDLPTDIVSYLLYAMVRKMLSSFLKLPLPQSHEEKPLCLEPHPKSGKVNEMFN